LGPTESAARVAGGDGLTSSFLSRILVAAVGLPLVVGLLWLGGWWLFVLVTIVALIALHEFYAVTRNLRPLVLAGYAGTLLALFGAQIGGLTWMLAGFMATFALAFLLKGLAETKQPTTVSVGTTVLGACWIGLGLGHLILLRDVPSHARLAALTVVLAVFAADTAAYFTGRLFGRHKLAPLTSPGKTWEGFVGGTIVAVLVPFFALYKQHYLSVPHSLLLGAVIAAAAPLGDLFESGIKRDMQVKDTGTLLAGHGGILDRIDAQLFAVVAAFYVLLAFGYR
jgi:phosphatidate cytidylyltransferase